ncbi:MAG: SMC-Scp complex subunit ScpB [Candidatus Nomurabacteria bacterium]
MLEKIITILYISGEPISITSIAELLQIESKSIEEILPEVENKIKEIGLLLLKNKEEISIVTDPSQAQTVESFWKEELKGDLTPATLQVLSIIAYLGNPTRQTISYIRGVQSAQSIRTLSVRGLIKRDGEVCVLTGEALKHLGITKIDELPQYESIKNELLEKMKVSEK